MPCLQREVAPFQAGQNSDDMVQIELWCIETALTPVQGNKVLAC